MNLFGKKKAAPQKSVPPAGATPQSVDTILRLKENLTLLEKREEHIGKKIEAALAEAKAKSLKKDKSGALFALKRKKMYEGEINKLQGARITLDSQILALESAAVNMETFLAMKSGADTMKHMRGDLDADKVEDIMENLQEERDIFDQISDAISRPGQELFDDQDLLDELAELEALDVEDEVAAVVSPPTQTVFTMPSVPTNTLKQQTAVHQQPAESEDERALRELERSMMMA